jgi:hypothetical protein
MKRTKTIYYNEHGQIDKFATYINNNIWFMPVWFILSIILIGIVEGL